MNLAEISRKRWFPWILPALVIVLWQLNSWTPLFSALLPSPGAVVRAFFQTTADGELPRAVVSSTRRAFEGFLIGSMIGILIGLLNGFLRFMELIGDTAIKMLNSIPALALIPVVIIWLGIGEASKIFLIAFGTATTIYYNTFLGVRSVDPKLIEMGRVYGFGRFRVIRSIILPSALPDILVGLRLSMGVAWIILIAAETIATDSGIGFMSTQAREFMQIDVVALCALLYAAVGKLTDMAFRWIESRAFAWDDRRRD